VVADAVKIITLKQVRSKQALLSWWLALSVIPVSSRIVLLICNRTRLSPNLITTCSVLFRLATASVFLQGEALFYVVGSVLFYFAAVCDAMDGPVARLTGKTSEFGRYFDHISDLVGDFLILAALAFGRGMLFEPLVIGMLFMHVAESYMSYLTNLAMGQREPVLLDESTSLPVVNIFLKYRQIFFSRNLKSFLSFPDYTASTFILFPVLSMPVLGLKIGFFLLLVTTLYTIFSSFVSIHTGERRFP
jgi:phosphatidylglycerophosphate synthase